MSEGFEYTQARRLNLLLREAARDILCAECDHPHIGTGRCHCGCELRESVADRNREETRNADSD